MEASAERGIRQTRSAVCAGESQGEARDGWIIRAGTGRGDGDGRIKSIHHSFKMLSIMCIGFDYDS